LPQEQIDLFQNSSFLCDFDPCCICGEQAGNEEDNHVLYCDGCNILVHSYCYGVTEIPAEDEAWLCRKCESQLTKVRCIFCPVKGGAFKKTNNGCWGHVVCALWIPELSFKNKEIMEPINQISKIPKSRWNLECGICHERSGVCIGCSEKGCEELFHVLCAREKGHSVETQPTTTKDLKFKAFCRKHSMRQYAEKQTRTFGFRSLTPELLESLQNVVQNSGRNFKSLPHKTIEGVYYYWKLKRKIHMGPLLRRLQFLERGPRFSRNISDQEYHTRFIKLRRDFEKLRLLIDLVRKREIWKKENVRIFDEIVEKLLVTKSGQLELDQTLERALHEKKENFSFQPSEEIILDEDISESEEVNIMEEDKQQEIKILLTEQNKFSESEEEPKKSKTPPKRKAKSPKRRGESRKIHKEINDENNFPNVSPNFIKKKFLTEKNEDRLKNRSPEPVKANGKKKIHPSIKKIKINGKDVENGSLRSKYKRKT